MKTLDDVVCMESHREVADPIQAQLVDNWSRITANEHTLLTTADVYGEDKSNEAKVQQLLYLYNH